MNAKFARLSRWIAASVCAVVIAGCAAQQNLADGGANDGADSQLSVKRGYAPVNGLSMYYEIWRSGTADRGTPLVLMHGGGSTIETSFGNILPRLAKHRTVIAFEQQGHGHTADISDRPFTFEQSADDAAGLLNLEIEKADFFGYSNGGSIALQVAIRHPSLARRLIVASAMFKRDGCSPEVWESMKHATLQSMPSELQDAYLKSAPHPEQLQSFHDKCVKRMLEFADWRAEDIHSISAPTLIMIGDNDIVRPEHAVEMYRPLPQAQLAVLPGTDHMQLVQRTNWEASMVEAFLDTFLPMTPPQGDHHEGSTGTQHWRAMDQAPINRRSDVRVKFRVPFHTIQVFQRST